MKKRKHTSKILFILCNSDVLATHGNLPRILDIVAASGVQIDIATCDQDLFGRLEFNQVRKRLVMPMLTILDHAFRDELLLTFLRKIEHVRLPYSDCPIYKIVAFDDFWGGISAGRYVLEDIGDYAAVCYVLPSSEDTCDDQFLSHMLAAAQAHGVPKVAFSLFPIEQASKIYAMAADHLVTTDRQDVELAARFFSFDPERVLEITAGLDRMAFNLVEDSFATFAIKNYSQLPPMSGLVIVIINHHLYRTTVRETLQAIGELPFPATVIFIKRDYTVRQMSEDEIIETLYRPTMQRMSKEVYMAKPEARAMAILRADVVISPTMLGPLTFAATYGKTAIVFNPLVAPDVRRDRLHYVDTPEALRSILETAHAEKQKQLTLAGIFKRFVR